MRRVCMHIIIPGPLRNTVRRSTGNTGVLTIFKYGVGRACRILSPSPSVWYGAAHRLIRMPDCYVRRMDGSISMCSATSTSFQTEGSAARSISQKSASPTTNPEMVQLPLFSQQLHCTNVALLLQ
jgi:hypothetical protein